MPVLLLTFEYLFVAFAFAKFQKTFVCVYYFWIVKKQLLKQPGLGLVIAGPIAAGLAGAGAGGLTGGLIGALVGSGIPEDHAKEYEKRVKEGRILMTVKAKNEEDAEDIEESWRSYSADADKY